MTRASSLSALAIACVLVSACGTADRIANIGRAPKLSPIDAVPTDASERSLAQQNLTNAARAQAATNASTRDNASLWRTGARAFFKDQRAQRVGDIVTVQIDIDDSAQVGNTTTRTRTNSEQAQLPSFLGLESKLDKILPDAVNPSNLINGNTQSRSTGNGEVQRRETVQLTVAAVVTGILPNGNMIIQGRQEVRVNFEVRELLVAGIVRPEDITRENTIEHTQIAEARISYGGRGQLTDVQQARYGQQLYDALFPF
jgi:flagellar L-ring protein FlgH